MAFITPVTHRARNARLKMPIFISRYISTNSVQPASSDQYVLGQDFPRIAETELHSSDDGQYLLANVANGDGGEHANLSEGFQRSLDHPCQQRRRLA